MTTRITTDNITDGTITGSDIGTIANSAVQWQSVITADGSTQTTGVAGQGYFIDTTSAAHTIVLPASPSVGDTIQIRDYSNSFGTNNVTLNVNGEKLAGTAANGLIETNNSMVTLVYSGTTKGWLSVENEAKTNLVPATYISATGGTITTSGDYKIHSFTGDGCFVVSTIGNVADNPNGGPAVVDYLVVAGGGGGGGGDGGGGGAGGFRESHSTCVSGPYTASPRATPTGLTLTATTYPVTVGAGGSGAANCTSCAGQGSNSIFSTITSAGGGFGASEPGSPPEGPTGKPGGSGGGAGNGGNQQAPGGTGNTPPVSPPQGSNGGAALDAGPLQANRAGGGGGGSITGGGTPGQDGNAGAGGNGTTTSIAAAPNGYSGGGGGGGRSSGGSGGPGGGGDGAGGGGTGQTGNSNTGGGGGGAGEGAGSNGGSGGKGIVIIRYKFQN
jgi:hypothetical protein